MATVVFQSTLLACHVARCCTWVSAMHRWTVKSGESGESGGENYFGPEIEVESHGGKYLTRLRLVVSCGPFYLTTFQNIYSRKSVI